MIAGSFFSSLCSLACTSLRTIFRSFRGATCGVGVIVLDCSRREIARITGRASSPVPDRNLSSNVDQLLDGPFASCHGGFVDQFMRTLNCELGIKRGKLWSTNEAVLYIALDAMKSCAPMSLIAPSILAAASSFM